MIDKDIKLIKIDDNNYDWNFQNNDLETVNHDDQIKNQIIQRINLNKNEMETDLYLDQGNELYNYLRVKHTDHVLLLIQEIILSSIKEIEGIRNVSLEYTQVGDILKFNIILLKNDGMELVFNDFTY